MHATLAMHQKYLQIVKVSFTRFNTKREDVYDKPNFGYQSQSRVETMIESKAVEQCYKNTLIR